MAQRIIYEIWEGFDDPDICGRCKLLAGKIFRQGIGPYPPLHRFCRCSRRYHHEEIEPDPPPPPTAPLAPPPPLPPPPPPSVPPTRDIPRPIPLPPLPPLPIPLPPITPTVPITDTEPTEHPT